jgi:hypothetical protein
MENKFEDKGKEEDFRKAAEPLIKFICENYHPHVTVIVTPLGAEVLEGIRSIRCEKFLVD